MRFLFLWLAFFASTSAFLAPAASSVRRGPSMIFADFFTKLVSVPGSKAVSRTSNPAPAKRSAVSFGPAKSAVGYVPEGLTKEKWEAINTAKARKEEEKVRKFREKQAKGVETLAEWQEKYEKGGGHRFVKTKYEGW